MQCAEFEQRFQQLLDARGNVEQDDLLREHAEGCDDCGAVLRTQGELFAGLRLIPESNLSQDLGVRVLDRLHRDRRNRRKRRLWIGALATAAAVMLALLPLAGERAQFRGTSKPRGGGLALIAPGQRDQPSARLTEQQSEEFRILMHQLVARLSDHRLTMFEPVDQLASGIRPLAITFNFAFDTLRRNLPGYSQPEPLEPQALYSGHRPPIS